MNRYELVLSIIHTYGIGVYMWKVECKKCKKITKIYAFHLDHDLAKHNSNFIDGHPMVALGDIPYLDKLFMKKYSSIKEFNVKNNINQICNTCVHCGNKQSRGFFVQGSHDLAEEPWYNHGKEKLPYRTIKIRNIEPLRTDIKKIYG